MKSVKITKYILLIGLTVLFLWVCPIFAEDDGDEGIDPIQAAEEVDGVGDVLIYPLYIATSDIYTEFTLVNTANSTTAVYIQIRLQGNSKDQLDFCIKLTKNDVYKTKIFNDGNIPTLETLNNVDGKGKKAPETAVLTIAYTSHCAYDTEYGYIVAYAVTDCDQPYAINSDAMIMGNTRIIETATSKIMAMNAVAVERNADLTFAEIQNALNKDNLYMIWDYCRK